MLDAVRGPGVGDRVIAPPPGRPYVRELDADAGGLRVGVLDRYPAGDPVHPDCADSRPVRLHRLHQAVQHHRPAAISLPLSWNSAGLPIGVQLVAAYGREDLLINVAAQAEQAAMGRPEAP